MKRICLLLLASTLILVGCSQIIEQSHEGDTWRVEFQTDQTIEDREESSFTFTYLPENKEDVEEFSFVTSTGITKKGIILDQSGTHTDTSFCTGCAQSPDHPIDIEISWITVEGEEFDKAITLN